MSAKEVQKGKHEAKPGDLIKIYCGAFQHWVVYIGNDEVVGLPAPTDGIGKLLIEGEAVVKRENIWDVIQNDRFRVYNLWDEKYKHRKENDIVKEACEMVGQKVPYSLLSSNSEHFAKRLRYGEQVFIKVKETSFSGPICVAAREHDAKPGDLIEMFRWFYQHWAVYVGNDEVVGLTSKDDGDGVIKNLMGGEAMVKCENIWRVVGDDNFRVNNLWDEKYEHRTESDIVKDAREMVGQIQPYSLFSHNCEHFATELRYGEAKSWQVKLAFFKVLGVAGAVATGGLATGVVLCSYSLEEEESEAQLQKEEIPERTQ